MSKKLAGNDVFIYKLSMDNAQNRQNGAHLEALPCHYTLKPASTMHFCAKAFASSSFSG